MTEDKNYKDLIKPIIGKLKSRKINIINTTSQELNNSNSNNNNNNSVIEKNPNTPKKIAAEREIEKEKLYFSIIVKNIDCESKNPIILSDILQNDMSIDKNLMLLSNKLMSHRIEVVKDKVNKESFSEEQILNNIFISLSRESFSMLDERYSENFLNKLRSKIFNFIGVDSNTFNSNVKINNSILNYFISNILDIKRSYKEKINLSQEEDENFEDKKRDFSLSLETFEKEYETIDNKLIFEPSFFTNTYHEFSKVNVESFEIDRNLVHKEKERNAHNKDLTTIISFFNTIKNDSSQGNDISKEEVDYIDNEEFINKEDFKNTKFSDNLHNPFLNSLSHNIEGKRKDNKSISILEKINNKITYTNSGYKNLKRHSIINNY